MDDEGATFGRIAAKIPARRMPAVIERLVDVYRADRRPAETATAFFQRVDVGRVKEALAEFERLVPEDAVPADFVDLGETTEFKVEAMDGECSA